MSNRDRSERGGPTDRAVREMIARARDFRETVQMRRTVREFRADPIPREVLEECLLAAGSAPSGANRQPWTFVVVTRADLKDRIRREAEAREREFYAKRAPREWKDALQPLGTDDRKPFLTEAPCLIAVFERVYEMRGGEKRVNYYTRESVGIATGILVTALHAAGLSVLTYTPSPMRFLGEILERPEGERPFLLIVTGFPAPGASLPEITRKPLDQIAVFR